MAWRVYMFLVKCRVCLRRKKIQRIKGLHVSSEVGYVHVEEIEVRQAAAEGAGMVGADAADDEHRPGGSRPGWRPTRRGGGVRVVHVRREREDWWNSSLYCLSLVGIYTGVQ